MSINIASLWIGPRLGPLEIASLHSFKLTGHDVTLYSYGPIANVPSGVTLRDAADIYPVKQLALYNHAFRPPACLHSNLFRYALIAQTDAIWCDLDVITLKPLDFQSPYIFGFETESSVNSAVLKLPENSPTLAALRKFSPDSRGLPPQIQGFKRFRRNIKSFGRGRPIADWPWGSTGPRALTIYLQKYGELEQALPISAFYHFGTKQHELFIAPGGLSLEDIPDEAYALHLWSSLLRRSLKEMYDNEIPSGSFLDERLNAARRDRFLLD